MQTTGLINRKCSEPVCGRPRSCLPHPIADSRNRYELKPSMRSPRRSSGSCGALESRGTTADSTGTLMNRSAHLGSNSRFADYGWRPNNPTLIKAKTRAFVPVDQLVSGVGSRLRWRRASAPAAVGFSSTGHLRCFAHRLVRSQLSTLATCRNTHSVVGGLPLEFGGAPRGRSYSTSFV